MTVLTFETATDWEAWLAGNHELEGGVWLKIAKKHAGVATVSIDEALDIALCYGWIDSQRKPYDATYYLQRYSRRRSKSPWSKINLARVEELTGAGRMRAPGLAALQAARVG